jgi:hypothetical protein
VGNAMVYDRALRSESRWKWLRNREVPEFEWAVDWFRKLYIPRLGDNTRRQRAFPGIGPLGSYLLASDYAMAGAVKMPSVTTIGGLLHTSLLDKGAVRGLNALGYKGTTKDECTDAFLQVHNYLESTLPATLRADMNFNALTTEHILCKYSRLEDQLASLHEKLSVLSEYQQDAIWDMWTHGGNRLSNFYGYVRDSMVSVHE